ncbi:MAG: type III-A CRISPR-associated protein Csm2 [Deltaproteobacteria bacterium]|nr:type III-A CRISPR-associated protein Csm2 [Deltaproteobacteria bacterium]MBW2078212.1 type III-A CRISPR-associated protein Csm2 [Deltaproteobacteria bacterium]
MDKIVLWKDRDNKKIDPTLFSIRAEELARELARDHKDSREKSNKRTQLRKFYDEVVRLDSTAKTKPNEWDNILPLVHMLVAKSAYAEGRKLVSDNFVSFIRDSIDQISGREDLTVFANFFEAFMGFYRKYGPSN